MLAIKRSSLKLSQSLRTSCLVVSELAVKANFLSFALKFTVMSMIELLSKAGLF